MGCCEILKVILSISLTVFPKLS